MLFDSQRKIEQFNSMHKSKYTDWKDEKLSILGRLDDVTEQCSLLIQILDEALLKQEPERCFEIEFVLELLQKDKITITKPVLEESKLGCHLNSVRKSARLKNNNDLTRRIKSLLRTWKNRFSDQRHQKPEQLNETKLNHVKSSSKVNPPTNYNDNSNHSNLTNNESSNDSVNFGIFAAKKNTTSTTTSIHNEKSLKRSSVVDTSTSQRPSDVVDSCTTAKIRKKDNEMNGNTSSKFSQNVPQNKTTINRNSSKRKLHETNTTFSGEGRKENLFNSSISPQSTSSGATSSLRLNDDRSRNSIHSQSNLEKLKKMKEENLGEKNVKPVDKEFKIVLNREGKIRNEESPKNRKNDLQSNMTFMKKYEKYSSYADNLNQTSPNYTNTPIPTLPPTTTTTSTVKCRDNSDDDDMTLQAASLLMNMAQPLHIVTTDANKTMQYNMNDGPKYSPYASPVRYLPNGNSNDNSNHNLIDTTINAMRSTSIMHTNIQSIDSDNQLPLKKLKLNKEFDTNISTSTLLSDSHTYVASSSEPMSVATTSLSKPIKDEKFKRRRRKIDLLSKQFQFNSTIWCENSGRIPKSAVDNHIEYVLDWKRMIEKRFSHRLLRPLDRGKNWTDADLFTSLLLFNKCEDTSEFPNDHPLISRRKAESIRRNILFPPIDINWLIDDKSNKSENKNDLPIPLFENLKIFEDEGKKGSETSKTVNIETSERNHLTGEESNQNDVQMESVKNISIEQSSTASDIISTNNLISSTNDDDIKDYGDIEIPQFDNPNFSKEIISKGKTLKKEKIYDDRYKEFIILPYIIS
ncbi:hypothetical protein SNEBB_009726 [Seison nebaliae]|nr:hypothetical protein SNEBB_009726 [Seison nebaliae]